MPDALRHGPPARPRPRRGGTDGEPTGVPDHGLRQVPVRGEPEGQGVAEEDDPRLDQGSEVPSQDRQGRFRHQGPPHARISSRTVTRSRSRCSSGAARWPTPSSVRRILDAVIERRRPDGKVENEARLEGRNMTMVLAPDKKAQDAIKKARPRKPTAKSAASETGEADSAPTPTRQPRRRTDTAAAGHTDAGDGTAVTDIDTRRPRPVPTRVRRTPSSESATIRLSRRAMAHADIRRPTCQR